jgi:8-oxo-dGTP diphosphatase
MSASPSLPAPLHVVAAVVVDAAGQVLIARRPDHLHQGGLWEFPGGKLEPGESPRQALARELHEELGIEVTAARPLIKVHHAYPDRRVLLDVWRVSAFSGEAHGREGQPVRWVAPEALPDHSFPAANLPIVTAARLPPCYLVTPEPGPREAWPGFLQHLGDRVAAGIRLVQLRAHGLDAGGYQELAVQALAVCRQGGARMLLNASPQVVLDTGADGVHLSGARLRALTTRPLDRRIWAAASCHCLEDLRRAADLGLDFAVLSPVQATESHPDAHPIGWSRFAEWVEAATLPVFALGGVGSRELPAAWDHGAQGIAAIRGLWTGASEPMCGG